MTTGGNVYSVLSGTFYALIILCFIILLYTAYISKNKSNILTMTQFYKKWDRLLVSEKRITKFIRHYAEKYFALALKIPGFDFNDPVYFVGNEIVHIKNVETDIMKAIHIIQ